jgi:hypothetical protein
MFNKGSLLFFLLFLWSNWMLCQNITHRYINTSEETKSASPKEEKITKVFLSPFEQTIINITDKTLIEPTSPVLGKNLVTHIRYSQLHPLEIIENIEDIYPNVYEEMAISSLAYTNTLIEGIEKYYLDKSKNLNVRESYYQVTEPYSIPIIELEKLNDSYRYNLLKCYYTFSGDSYNSIKDSAMCAANFFREERKKSFSLVTLNEAEESAKKILPKHFDKLVDLHSNISSPECAYPRIQFSINGYTQHVFDELLKLERLEELLLHGYQLHKNWLIMAKNNQLETPLYSYVCDGLSLNGFSYNEALLFLCYTTRNMPSIDIQYAYGSRKALLLEVYFWQIKKIYKEALENYSSRIYPNKSFKDNPGLYHYATASYLAYKTKKNGYVGITALSLSIFNKIGYKTHKLIHGINPDLPINEKITDIYLLAKKQGFKGGFDAGYWGGKYGIRLAKKEKNKSRIIPISVNENIISFDGFKN